MRIFSTLIALVFITLAAQGQTILFETGFDDPGSFALNTTDVGSSTGGANTWLINSVYTGGDGLADCLGFELPFTIPSTAAQPVGINDPNGPYLHVTSTEALNDGILCCSFGAADGFCTSPGNHFARMTSDVSTLGSSEVTLTFWWLCNGGTSNYGEVYYSVNGGVDWTVITTPIQQYRNTTAWSQQAITLPAFAGQATLRFGFRFVNQQSLFSGSDPGFAIDDVVITGSGSASLSVSSPELGADEFCIGSEIDIPYTASGPFEVGNTFAVELSDASGSFTSAVVIGSLVSSTSGTISCTWPGFAAPGTGYRVRIVSDLPAVEGPANDVDLSLFAIPFPGTDAVVTACPGGPTIFLFDELGGAPVTCGSWTDPFGAPFDGVYEPGVDTPGPYTYTTDCDGPCLAQEAQVLIEENFGAGSDVEAELCANGELVSLYDYINGGPQTGSFFLDGAPVNNVVFNEAGIYEVDYVVAGTGGCAADSAAFVFDVIAPPNAGTSLSYTTCITTPPFALIGLLNGAEAGGSWTDPDGDEVTGIIDPAADPAGLYTYTVPGTAPCTEDQAFVALVIDPCTGILELADAGVPVRWLGQGPEGHRLVHGTDRVPVELRVLAADGRDVACRWTAAGDQLLIQLGNASEGAYAVVFRIGEMIGRSRIVHRSW